MPNSNLPPKSWGNIANRYESEYQQALKENTDVRRQLADAKAENERLRDVLGSIDGMYQYILDDSAVSEKPKPTWQEFADWVHEQVSDTLEEATDETPTA